jgi:putative membrane protein
LGVWLWISLGVTPRWLLIKLVFVAALFLYHLSLHVLYKQQSKGIFKYNSMQLRIWNEAATIFLIAIVMLVVVKQGVSLLWGGLGLVLLMIIFMIAIKIYKAIRMKTDSSPQKK